MTKDEALKLALELFEDIDVTVINVIKEALAQPEQEPVAWATREDFYRELEHRLKHIREEMKIKTVTMRCKDYDVALSIIYNDFGRVLVGQPCIPPKPKEPEQEPVAWMDDYNACKCSDNETRCFSDRVFRMMQKYTAPPQREWVGLTDEEIASLHYKIKVQLMGAYKTEDIYRTIEAYLKEKNT